MSVSMRIHSQAKVRGANNEQMQREAYQYRGMDGNGPQWPSVEYGPPPGVKKTQFEIFHHSYFSF